MNDKQKPRAIFVSHSNQDKELLQALTDLLKAAFRLPAKEILCTSIAGHKLAGGANTEEELLALLRGSRLLIGVLTPASLSSSYVLFELGARWGLQKPLIALVASGARMADIKEPLNSKNALNVADQDDVHQFIEDVGTYLEQESEPTSAYNVKVRQFVSAAKVQKNKPLQRNPALSSKLEAKKLLWTKLIEGINVETDGPENGCALFQRLADHHGLKPFSDPSRSAPRQVTCAGAALYEEFEWESVLKLADLRKYRFELAPELFEKTAPIIDIWRKRMGKIRELKIRLVFVSGVTVEREPQRITANVFETELAMTQKDTFEYGKHCFYLRPNERSFSPDFQMNIWSSEKLGLIPWFEILTALVKRQVLRLEKSLDKSIWG